MRTDRPSIKLQVYTFVCNYTRENRPPDVWLNKAEYRELITEVNAWDIKVALALPFPGFRIYGADIRCHENAPSIYDAPRPWLVHKSIKKITR